MSKDEVEAVLGHEVAHVANGDMVTLTLIQGVVNTFVIFLSRIIGRFVDQVIFRSERGHGPGFFITVMVAQLVLGIVASMIVAWFSRQREFRADAGGAHLAGRQKMIGALEGLQRAHEPGRAAGRAPGLRHLRRPRPVRPPLHDPPAAAGAHCGPAVRNVAASARRLAERQLVAVQSGQPAVAHAGRIRACAHMLRRYCPPTSNSAFVICPSEHTRTASISTSNTLRLSITA